MDWLGSRQDAIEAGLARRHLGRSPARPGWRCSTCRPRGWRARTARWPPAAIPGTARRARCRSSTGCSPTPKAGQWRSGSSRQHRRPVRVHHHRGRGAEEVRAGQDGHGRRPWHDHQRPDPGPEPAGRRDPAARPLRVDHRAARPAIRELMADGGPLQLSLSGEQDLAEITSPDFPGERLIAGRNPVRAPSGPASARTCWPPPGSCSPRSSPGYAPASSPALGPSGSRPADGGVLSVTAFPPRAGHIGHMPNIPAAQAVREIAAPGEPAGAPRKHRPATQGAGRAWVAQDGSRRPQPVVRASHLDESDQAGETCIAPRCRRADAGPAICGSASPSRRCLPLLRLIGPIARARPQFAPHILICDLTAQHGAEMLEAQTERPAN
jgi:hypothetical protein